MACEESYNQLLQRAHIAETLSTEALEGLGKDALHMYRDPRAPAAKEVASRVFGYVLFEGQMRGSDTVNVLIAMAESHLDAERFEQFIGRTSVATTIPEPAFR